MQRNTLELTTLRRSRRRAVGRAVLILAAVLALAGVGTGVAQAADPPALAPAELTAMLAPLASNDESARRAAARRLLDLGPEATDALAGELASRRLQPGGDAAVLAAIKDVRGRTLREGPDANAPTHELLDDLLRWGDGAAPHTALVTECIVGALAHIGTPRAVALLALASGDDGGAFRLEIARLVHELGDRAIPGLIRARKGTTPAVARWASSQLEALNRRVPGDCVQTKDPAVLAEVLRAFGAVLDADALGVVLSFVNAERDIVRNAARETVLVYGESALQKLRESYTATTGKAVVPDWAAPDVARALFAADDALRLQDVNVLVDSGFTKQEAGDLEHAVADFDRALARDPELDRRGQMVPAYVTYAFTLEETDRTSSEGYLRKALLLAPDGPRAAQAQSELDYLEADDLQARGVIDPELLRKSIAHDPTNIHARSALDRLDDDTAERQARIRHASIAGGALAALLVVLVLFVGRRKAKPT